jgi:ABC-type Fe3+ transport system substrate-binding protein
MWQRRSSPNGLKEDNRSSPAEPSERVVIVVAFQARTKRENDEADGCALRRRCILARDLLHWKSKIGLDPLPNNYVRGALRAFGEKKALEFFHQLVETQDMQFRRGRPLQAQFLAAGEFAASPELRLSLLKELKASGAPVDYHIFYPFPVTLAATAIFKTAPHPHASALFVDYWLLKEGQQFLLDRQFTVMREGMSPSDPETN